MKTKKFTNKLSTLSVDVDENGLVIHDDDNDEGESREIYIGNSDGARFQLLEEAMKSIRAIDKYNAKKRTENGKAKGKDKEIKTDRKAKAK